MSKNAPSARDSIVTRRRAFTFIEILLVLAIIALFILCLVGFFLSRQHETRTPLPRKTGVRATPPPATPDVPAPVPQAPVPRAPALPTPAAPAAPAPASAPGVPAP